MENLILDGPTAQRANGNNLNNVIIAGVADDTINGGAGNDIIRLGKGAYALTGGAGDNIFDFKVGDASTSHITDFHVGQDLIDLRPITAAVNHGYDPMADGILAIAPDGHGGSIISIDPTHSGTMHALADLAGVTPNMLIVGADILF